jgi:hypothetical protein
MAKGKVRDKDKGYRRALALFPQMAKAKVTVGLHGDAEPYEDGRPETVAEIASHHEFGEGVPQREFFRPTIDGNRDKYGALIERLARIVIDGKKDLRWVLAFLGTQVATDLKLYIVHMTEPELSPTTIAAKGSSALLQDTGHLKQSITYDVTIGDQSVDHPGEVG